MKLLIVEDEPNLLSILRKGFAENNNEVSVAMDGKTAMEMIHNYTFDVVILDVMLPDVNGIEICRRLRAAKNFVPILLLTALGTSENIVTGLNSGADDYLVKPFALQELHARLQALYKRSHGKTDNLLTVADLTLNKSTLQVHRAGQRLDVNPACLKLLQRLMEQAPAVVMRDELETLLWADERPDGDALRSHMYKLRQAIDRPFACPLIHTVHRIGYRLAEDAE